ncbi:MAG TPA: rhodanese-like domain-containing protein [Burkholderiaceae bacterium]|jgi:rhodanese-related sulfurtransferase|nr:rhodanese-like domain-containing protein [Burkholderiaceae bacterium]
MSDIELEPLLYAGALTPREAHAMIEAGAAVLVDVRTEPEWLFVGRVASGVHIEWRRYGETHPNPAFLDELRREVDPSMPVIFICRSGVRSHEAATAAAAAGYEAYNLVGGFEGDLDHEGRRNRLNGWRSEGLPWVQS